MWNLYSCSKIIQQRQQSKSYELHRKKLSQMQPIMKVQAPYQPDFVYTKNKLNMSRRDRRVQIDRLNKILLQKMEGIKDEDYPQNKLRPEAQNLKTLNAHTIDTMNHQIATENQRFCKKLMKAKSFYPTNNILQKTEELDYIGTNISLNARRANSVRNLQSARSRPRSNYTTNFSSHKRVSKQNFGTINEQNKRQFKSERPQTAPMFSRSQKNLIGIQNQRQKQFIEKDIEI